LNTCAAQWNGADVGQNDQAAEHLAKARALRARYYDLAAAREFQAAAEGAAPSADLLIEWGQCLGSQEDWEGAIEKYEQAAALDPNRSDAYLFWGGALESLGEPEEAADRYQAAATRDPHNSSAYLGLADAYSKQGRWSEAIQTYARAIEIDSDNVGGLVAALEELGGDEKAKAIEGLDARFGAHPQYARTLTSWGQVLTWDDKHIEASERYRKAASIDPTFQPGRIELGKALLQMGQIRDAAASLIEAIPLDVTSFSDFETLDEALAKLTPGDTAEASNKLRRAFTNAATMAEFYVAWGDDLARRDRHDEAITRYKTALEDDPRSAGAHLGLGDVLAQQKKYKAAAEMYGQAAKAHPRSASAFSRWGDALASDGRHAESAKRYRQALAIDPTAVEASHLLALLAKVEPHEKAVTLDVLSRSLARSADPAAYLRWGDELRAAARFEEAGKQYEQAALLSRHQGNKALEQRAYFQWGYLLLGRWNWPDAIDKFAKAPEEFAEPDIHLNWGWALFKMRRYDDAIQHYQQVLNTDATDAGAHHYWGLALAEQRRHSEAIEHYERALAL
jgi:tetratricopeptide (TPR) repeat protein